jgi:hypothetical protein
VESITINSKSDEYFASTSTILRPSTKLRVEQLLSITIGYLSTVKDIKDHNNKKTMKILLDSGCAATLMNHSLIKILDTDKEKF